MSDLAFETTTHACILGDEHTTSGRLDLRLIGADEVRDGGERSSVWEWTYQSVPEACRFAGTIRGPAFREAETMFEVAGRVLEHVRELMSRIEGTGPLRRFRTAAVYEADLREYQRHDR